MEKTQLLKHNLNCQLRLTSSFSEACNFNSTYFPYSIGYKFSLCWHYNFFPGPAKIQIESFPGSNREYRKESIGFSVISIQQFSLT